MPNRLNFHGGPLDGEVQVVEDILTQPGAILSVQIPTWLHWDNATGTPTDRGLFVEYAFDHATPAPTTPAPDVPYTSDYYLNYAEVGAGGPAAPIPQVVVVYGTWNGTSYDPGPITAGTVPVGATFPIDTMASLTGQPISWALVTSVDWGDGTTNTAKTHVYNATVSDIFVQIATSDGRTGQGTVFSVVPAPPPTLPDGGGVSPASGPRNTANPVTITGTSLNGSTGVTFGGMAATNVVVVSSTQITCNTPLYASAASVVVIVQNPRGNASTIDPAYTFT